MERYLQFLTIFGLCLALSFVHSQVQYGCKKADCGKITCEDSSKCYGRLIKNGSLECGCCDHCVRQLEEGAECDLQVNNALPRFECGNGLMCVGPGGKAKGKCEYAQTNCVKDQRKFDEQKSGQEGFTMGKQRPNCNTFGEYEPVQCKEHIKCYCVDKDGNKIFGEAPYTEENKMTCSCSRDYENFKPYVKDPSDAYLFLRCSSNGNFAPTQCSDDRCYCVDKLGNVTKRPVDKEYIRDLFCQGEENPQPNIDTPCIAEYKRKLAEIKNFTGKMVLGIEPPSCDMDGSYSAVQCKGFECYCVNKQGDKFTTEKTIRRRSEEANKMTCNCNRQKALLNTDERNEITDIFSQYKCRINGNYLPVQCTTAVCFCVDEQEGFQEGPPVAIGLRKNLPCYTKENAEEIDNLLNILWD